MRKWAPRGKAHVPSGRCSRHGCARARPAVRISVLLAILAALVAGLVFHATHSSTSGPSAAPPRTAASEARRASGAEPRQPAHDVQSLHQLAAGHVLKDRGTVPRAPRHLLWKQHRRPPTQHVLTTLLANFHVRMGRASCTDIAELPIGSCNGSATIPGYVLGFIVTAERPVHPDERPGTQVILFAIKRA